MLIGYSYGNADYFRGYFWPIGTTCGLSWSCELKFFAPYYYDITEFIVYGGTPWLIWGLMKYVKKSRENELNK
jgi:hypothetical protein